jgi:hypothetical protein
VAPLTGLDTPTAANAGNAHIGSARANKLTAFMVKDLREDIDPLWRHRGFIAGK